MWTTLTPRAFLCLASQHVGLPPRGSEAGSEPPALSEYMEPFGDSSRAAKSPLRHQQRASTICQPPAHRWILSEVIAPSRAENSPEAEKRNFATARKSSRFSSGYGDAGL